MTLIQTFRVSQPKPANPTVGRQRRGFALLLLISLVLLGGIGTRLAYLQLITGKFNREKAEDNRIRIIPKSPVG